MHCFPNFHEDEDREGEEEGGTWEEQPLLLLFSALPLGKSCADPARTAPGSRRQKKPSFTGREKAVHYPGCD